MADDGVHDEVSMHASDGRGECWAREDGGMLCYAMLAGISNGEDISMGLAMSMWSAR